MNEYKIVLDTGKIVCVTATSRALAIKQYCKECGASEEWVKKHAVVKNLGGVK